MLHSERHHESQFWHTQRVNAPAKLLAAVLALGSLLTQPVAAQDRSAQAPSAGLSPTYVWLSASAALLTASLGGVFALRVGAIYEQAQALPPVSPARSSLRHEAEHAELRADGLFAGAALLGVASVLLALATDWHHFTPANRSNTIEWAQRDKRHIQLAPMASRDGAGLVLRGALP